MAWLPSASPRPSQVLLMRELVAAFCGNELLFGLVLAALLVLV